MLIVWTGSGEPEPFLGAFLHLYFNYFDPDQLISLFFFHTEKNPTELQANQNDSLQTT